MGKILNIYDIMILNWYNRLINRLHENQREGTEIFYRYIGEKFAEIATENEDIYKITSAYSNLITEGDDIDGILFPSVAFGNRGYNLALKPKVIDDQKIRLIAVSKNTFLVGEGENDLPSFTETNMEDGILNWTNGTVEWNNE